MSDKTEGKARALLPLITYHLLLITFLTRPAAFVPRGDGVGARGGLLCRGLVQSRDAGRGERAGRDGLDGLARGHVLSVAHALAHNLLLKHHDGVYEHLGARGAAGDVNVHGHDLVDALHYRV